MNIDKKFIQKGTLKFILNKYFNSNVSSTVLYRGNTYNDYAV